MSPAAPEFAPPPREDEAAPYRDFLDELITIGMEVARELRHQIPTNDIADIATAFDRVARAVRRTVHLAQRLAEAPPPAAQRTAARRQIIRAVENAIARDGNPADADALRAELDERLDDPALDEDIHTRPVAEVITDICRDLGVEMPFPGLTFPRRTPEEVCAMARQAAAGARPSPATIPRHRAAGPGPLAPAGPGRSGPKGPADEGGCNAPRRESPRYLLPVT